MSTLTRTQPAYVGRNWWTSCKIYFLPWTLTVTKKTKQKKKKTESDTFPLHRRRSLRYLLQFHRPAERNWHHHYNRVWVYNTKWVWNDEKVANRPLHDPKEYVIRNFQISTGPATPGWKFRHLSRKATNPWLSHEILKTPTEKFCPKFYKDACLLNLEERRWGKIPPWNRFYTKLEP